MTRHLHMTAERGVMYDDDDDDDDDDDETFI